MMTIQQQDPSNKRSKEKIFNPYVVQSLLKTSFGLDETCLEDRTLSTNSFK